MERRVRRCVGEVERGRMPAGLVNQQVEKEQPGTGLNTLTEQKQTSDTTYSCA